MDFFLLDWVVLAPHKAITYKTIIRNIHELAWHLQKGASVSNYKRINIILYSYLKMVKCIPLTANIADGKMSSAYCRACHLVLYHYISLKSKCAVLYHLH